jgi:uncharacterized membrane protein HdeD (DUF308 family)
MFDGPMSEGRSMQTAAVVLICLLGIALSVKSIATLGRVAPWTSAGWWLTVVYFFVVIGRTTISPAVPVSAEYIVLVGLAVVFVVAGVRDERQAEPWWWPNHRGSTRAEKAGTT